CDQEHHALDEGAFSRIFLWRKNFPKPLFELVGLFNPWWWRSEFREAFSTPNGCVPWRDGSFDFPTRWFWRDGRITNDLDGEHSFPYFHFAIWKRDAWPGVFEPSRDEMRALAARSGWGIGATGLEVNEA